MFKSNVCRLSDTELGEVVQAINPAAGVNPVPVEVIPARQLRILDPDSVGPLRVTLKPHRGSMIAVIPEHVAADLVRSGDAEPVNQALLVYSMSDYLSDKDVQADVDEFERANAAANAGEDLVAVAMIGESRSTLAVCRNIVSGCQNAETLVDDARGAMDASNVFLVETD